MVMTWRAIHARLFCTVTSKDLKDGKVDTLNTRFPLDVKVGRCRLKSTVKRLDLSA
jgi:hypothetical protein